MSTTIIEISLIKALEDVDSFKEVVDAIFDKFKAVERTVLIDSNGEEKEINKREYFNQTGFNSGIIELHSLLYKGATSAPTTEQTV